MIWTLRDPSKWHDWYAWRPVRLKDGRGVCFEAVRRRYVNVGNFDRIMRWQYCMPGDEW